MNQEAMAYLDEAMDFIQRNSVRRERIDWPVLRQEVYALAAHAQTPAETYPAIQLALERLGDHHSFFLDPVKEQLRLEGKVKHTGLYAVYPEGVVGLVSPGSVAEAAGIKVGDRIETLDHQPITLLTFEQFQALLKGGELDLSLASVRDGSTYSVHLQASPFFANRSPEGRRLEGGIGYLDLPGLRGHAALNYAEIVQCIISEIDQTTTCGWIVDLRRNTGGNMWPMLVGIGPVLGEGECILFVTSDEQEGIFYQQGRAFSMREEEFEAIEQAYTLKQSWPPVAVLTSPLTASSGEFVTLAFRGRPRTRSFGEPTFGVPTANDDKRLGDGALILLTNALGADRTGQSYDSPVPPDFPVKIDWTRLGTDDDPVLQAALRWLRAEEGCS